MKNQLIPPPGMEPPSNSHLTPGERVMMWAKLVDESEAVLMANLRRQHGSEAAARAAFREWYARRMDEHDQTMYHMMREISRRSRGTSPAEADSAG